MDWVTEKNIYTQGTGVAGNEDERNLRLRDYEARERSPPRVTET